MRRARPRLARNARTYEITLANGTKIRRTSSDPGRALLTGFVGGPAGQDDWNKFDVPGLRGISKTAPYFHNNSAATLEEVVDHYIEFFKRVQANAAAGRRATDRDAPTACTSIGGRRPKSAKRCSRTCESSRTSTVGPCFLLSGTAHLLANPAQWPKPQHQAAELLE